MGCSRLAAKSGPAAGAIAAFSISAAGLFTEISLDYKQYTDEALAQRIRQQDTEALAELYDRYAQVLYNLIFRLIPDPAIAGETLQETFWQVWQERGNVAGQGAVLAWLWRLARIKTIEQLRQAGNFSTEK